MDKLKWYTEVEYFDIENGEQITKSVAQREYIVIKTTKKSEINEHIGIIRHTRECQRNKQYKLWE